MIEGFRDLFLTPTIEIIKEFVTNMPNLNTWIRDKKSTPAFLDKVTDKIQTDVSLESKYKEFISEYKQ